MPVAFPYLCFWQIWSVFKPACFPILITYFLAYLSFLFNIVDLMVPSETDLHPSRPSDFSEKSVSAAKYGTANTTHWDRTVKSW